MKKKLLCILFFSGATYATAVAQPTIKHQRTIGGNKDDYFTSMYLTKDGGLIVGGYSFSDSSGNKSENSRGERDCWVVKFDSSGKIEWDKTIGGNSVDELYALQQTADGGYILGVSSTSNISGEKTAASMGNDYWIIKLDSLGNIQWDKTIGGNSGDYLRDIRQTYDGGYILGGYSLSGISGDKTEEHHGGIGGAYDYWVVKLDVNGNKQWDKTMGGYAYDWFSAVVQTRDSGYLVGGYSNSSQSAEKTEDSKGLNDYWIVKLDKQGKIKWDKTIGGNYSDNLYSIQQTKDGGFILAGSSDSPLSGDKTEPGNGQWDYWIVKLDSIGNIEWDKSIGGSSEDYCGSVEQTNDGGYILGGSSYSTISGNKTEMNRGSEDYWVVKLDNQGNIEWDKTIGGGLDDNCTSIKEAGKNRYVAGGYSPSPISGDKKQKRRGGYDYWLVGLFYKPESNIVEITSASTVLDATDKNVSRHFTAYPNPAKDILHIQHPGKATVSLNDQSGKILLTKTINGNGEINVSQLSAGLYYLKNNATGAVQKIVVIK